MGLAFAAFLTSASVENAKFCFHEKHGQLSKLLGIKDHEQLRRKHATLLHKDLGSARRLLAKDYDPKSFSGGWGVHAPYLALYGHCCQ